jgi:hypothetical protein
MFQLNLAFFGVSFFKDLNYVDVNGPVNARLLDAVQAFAAIERTGSVKFGIGKRLMSIDIKQAFPSEFYLFKRELYSIPMFPDFQPHSLADLYALSDLPITSSRNSTNSSRLSPAPPIQQQSLATTVILENSSEDDNQIEAPVSPPHSAQLLGFSERSNSQTGLLGMNMAAAAKNRGRRVSFGTIREFDHGVCDQHMFRRDPTKLHRTQGIPL